MALRFFARGKCSWFGGPKDTSMTLTEGLALIQPNDIKALAFRDLFLPNADPTKGLGRQLNPEAYYLACRWDYAQTPQGMLRQQVACVRNPVNGLWLLARPADWGPGDGGTVDCNQTQDTGRAADLSPGILDALGLETDDLVEVSIA